MTILATIVGRHFKRLGTRLMIVSDNPTVDEIETQLVKTALRLKDEDWTALFAEWRVGVCDVSLKLERKEIP